MSYERDSTFTRAMMAGLFIGIVDTLICLAYNAGYRDINGYISSEIINVSSLIFAVNLLLLGVGMIHSLFIKLFGKRDIVFVILSVLATVFFTWKTEMGHRFVDRIVNNEFKGLLLGIVLILGTSVSGLPMLYRGKFYDKYILQPLS